MTAVHPGRDRADVFAGVVALLFLVGLAVVVLVVLIETQYRPAESWFGHPTRIPACDRSYIGPGRELTRADIDAAMTPGYAPAILEPTIGGVPFGGAVPKVRTESGDLVCDTVIYLRVGGDHYASYELEGGP